MSVDTRPPQQPCSHCGDCARACPEGLDPQTLFFALVGEDWNGAWQARLPACTECGRCEEVCPSHIPLLDWLRWGKTELHRQQLLRERADTARVRYQARNARLARERGEREDERALRMQNANSTDATHQTPAPTISKDEVMAAIARGRARREALERAKRATTPRHVDKDVP